MKKYFENVTSLEELKKAYKAACLKLHPDKGGDAKEFAAMQSEYEETAKLLAKAEQGQARHNKKDGTAKTAEEILQEQKEFAEVLQKLINLNGLQLEVCGSWLWISGNTYEWRAEIKGAGCKFANKKKIWYWHAGEWIKKVRRTLTMDEIRELHGSEIIKGIAAPRLAAAM